MQNNFIYFNYCILEGRITFNLVLHNLKETMLIHGESDECVQHVFFTETKLHYILRQHHYIKDIHLSVWSLMCVSWFKPRRNVSLIMYFSSVFVWIGSSQRFCPTRAHAVRWKFSLLSFYNGLIIMLHANLAIFYIQRFVHYQEHMVSTASCPLPLW